MDDEGVMPFDTDDPEEHVWTLATENDQQCARMWLARCELIVRGYALAAAAGRAEFVTCEMAATFFLDERTASSQLCEARQLLELPALIEAVSDGRVRLPHARAVLDELRPLDPALAARVLDDTLPRLTDQPPANVRKITRRAIVRADPAAAEARRQHATANRSAFVRPLPDGMADLTLNLRAETAMRIHGLASAATAADDGSGRSADARRADWIVEQILTAADRTPGDGQDHTGAGGGAGGGAGAGAGAGATAGGDGRVGSGEALDSRRRRSCQVLITMDVRTALGLDDEPCELDGYGTITAQHGRELLATAELRKVCLDPITGQVLHVDQTLHRPTDPPRPDRPHRPQRPDPTQGSDGPEAPTGSEITDDDEIPGDDEGYDGHGSFDGADAGPDDDEGYGGLGSFAGAEADTADESDDGSGSFDHADVGTDAADDHATGRRGRDTERHQPAATGPGVREALRRMLTESSWMPTDDEPQYRPSAALTRTVQTRSATCTFPCCSTGSRYCDLDHRDPWPTGPTHADNLAPTSRRHHRAKQAGWTPFPAHDGGTLWQAPSGRVYRKPPGRPVPPGRRIS